MSDPKHYDLEDIISNLNIIREELAEGITATSNGLGPVKEHPNRDEDPSSLILEEYLASRLQQIGEVTAERKEIKGLKTGNGWDPNQVIEHVFKIDPVSIKRAVEIAVSSDRRVKERLSNFFKRSDQEMRIVGTPTVEYIPIWKVKGFHECYYVRTNSYRVNVKDDVVAVEVEGQSRDLILERKHSRLIPTAILERLQKLGSFLTNESKYFVVSDALELATKRSEGELVVTGTGRPLTRDEETELTAWRTKRIFDIADLKVRDLKVTVRESISKEALLNKFRESVVRMPERFKQILSNKLQITELKRIYVPVIRVPMQRGLVPREVIVNGTRGEIADPKLLALLE
ncbi:MAG: hypothetical protein ABSE39_08525 [Candidatus Bathyarchaeia archaeon]